MLKNSNIRWLLKKNQIRWLLKNSNIRWLLAVGKKEEAEKILASAEKENRRRSKKDGIGIALDDKATNGNIALDDKANIALEEK